MLGSSWIAAQLAASREALSSMKLVYVYVTGSNFFQRSRLQMRAEFGLQSPPVCYAFHHTGHEMWTGFLNNPLSRLLSRSGDVIPKGPWTAVGACSPSLFVSDFIIGHQTWGMTSQFPTFVSHQWSDFLRVLRLMVLVTHSTTVLHAGSQVTCHSFLNLRLCFSRLSRPADPC
jgi:hypothetical protein